MFINSSIPVKSEIDKPLINNSPENACASATEISLSLLVLMAGSPTR